MLPENCIFPVEMKAYHIILLYEILNECFVQIIFYTKVAFM